MPSPVAMFLMSFSGALSFPLVNLTLALYYLEVMSPPLLLYCLSSYYWSYPRFFGTGLLFYFVPSLLRTVFLLFRMTSLFCFTSLYNCFTFFTTYLLSLVVSLFYASDYLIVLNDFSCSGWELVLVVALFRFWYFLKSF